MNQTKRYYNMSAMHKQLNERTYHFLKAPDPSIKVGILPHLVRISKLPFWIKGCKLLSPCD